MSQVSSGTAQMTVVAQANGSFADKGPTTVAIGAGASANRASRALKGAAVSWFTVAVLGQWMFVAYVIGFYGSAAIRGRFEEWNKVLPHGYVAGDTVGNLVVSLHLLFAVVVIVGGALQLLPQVRRIAPAFHRWNGRVYLSSVLLMSVGGPDHGVDARCGRRPVATRRDQPQRGADHRVREHGAAPCTRAAHRRTSPLGAAPVPGGERRLVLPRRPDVLDRRQPGAGGLRPEDVPGALPHHPRVCAVPAAAGGARAVLPRAGQRRTRARVSP